MRTLLILFTFIFFSFTSFQEGYFTYNLEPTFPNTSYSEQIAPILYANCTGCHHQGGIAPMPLMNYQQVFSNRNIIQYNVLTGKMPPWPPDTNYSRFRHERVLSEQEINLINNWVNNGAIQGDSTLAPTPPNYASTQLALGTPDLTINAPIYESDAFEDDDYVCFTIPSQLLNDKKIRAVEVTPGNLEIVHHCLVYIDPEGESTIGVENNCMGPSNGVLVGEFAPGSLPITYPGDENMAFGMNFPANSNVILAMHYPVGSLGKIDSTKVHFYFYPDEVNLFREIQIEPMIQNFEFCIPANETKTINDNFQLPSFYPSISMFGVFPHMHLIGKSIETYGLNSLGDTINFIRIPDWDFEWQGAYHFNKLMKIDPGTTVNASAYYENTSSNSHNPNEPPQEICAGFNTTDEMFVIYYLFTPYMAGDENLNLDSLTPNITTNFSCQEKSSFKSCYVSPNPVLENFIVQSNWPSNTIEKVEFYDLNGKLIWFSKHSSNNQSPLKKSFELSKISSIKKSNVYLLRIYNKNGEVQYAKLITQ